MRPVPNTLVFASLALVLAVLATPAVVAQDAIAVGTKEARPFSFKDENGAWTGISIDLWNRIAGELGLESRFEERELDELVSGLESGELGASVAALTVTADRERRIDFTHAFYTAGLGIAVPAEKKKQTLLGAIFSWAFLKVVGGLALVLLAAGALVWFFERKQNPDEFGGKRGIWEGFWWSAVTMTTVGYGDRSPKSTGGRLVALVWMFTSIIMISAFTASIASTLTVGNLSSDIRGPDDLKDVGRVATLQGSTSAAWLKRTGIGASTFDSLDAGLEAVAAGEASAMVYDAPILQDAALNRFSGKIAVLPVTFRSQDYAIGLPEGSPLRERINRAILAHVGSPEWDETLASYLGEDTAD